MKMANTLYSKRYPLSVNPNLEYNRNGSSREVKISRYLKDQLDRSADFTAYQPEECYRLIRDSVGYIYLGKIRNEMLENIFSEFAHTRGIIIDIRNYPSEFVVFTLGRYLMPEPVEFVKFTTPDLSYPGLFSWNDPPAVGEYNPDYYKGRVVILVNEISQSQAEYTAMALRSAPSAIVIGSTTAGADVTINLPAAATAGDGWQLVIKKVGTDFDVALNANRPRQLVKDSLPHRSERKILPQGKTVRLRPCPPLPLVFLVPVLCGQPSPGMRPQPAHCARHRL